MQLIIPAYNEAMRLPRTLAALRRFVAASHWARGALEVLVVDNASTDATAEVAAAADCALLPVRVVPCAVRGKGAAVRAGVEASTADIVGFMDADGATDLSALDEALDLLAAGADVALGSRAVPGAVTTERHSTVRALGARGYRRLTRYLVPGIADTQCGFKVMRGDLAREVFGATTTIGFSFDVEVLARASRGGARLAEFPVIWTDVPGSTFSPARHGFSSFASLAAIGLRLGRRDAVPAFAPALAPPVLAGTTVVIPAPVAAPRLELVAEA